MLDKFDTIDLNSEFSLVRPVANFQNAQKLMDIYLDKRIEKYIPDDLIPHNIEAAMDSLSYYGSDSFSVKYWSIIKKDNNEMVGLVGFCDINHANKRAEVAYELDPAYWHRGIASAAVRKICEIMFEECGIQRIQANVLPENTPSIKLLNRIGFVNEGLLESYRFFKNEYVDVMMFGYSAKKYFSEKRKINLDNAAFLKSNYIPSHKEILQIFKKERAVNS